MPQPVKLLFAMLIWIGACSGDSNAKHDARDAGGADAADGTSGKTGTHRDAGTTTPTHTSDAGGGSGGKNSGSSTDDAGHDSGSAHQALDAGPPPPNPCVDAGTCPPGVWTNVTPAGVDLTNELGCGNYGTQTMQRDAAHPGDLYTLFMCQGIWKSSDYGQTWSGPINTGNLGAVMGDCAGGITIASSAAGKAPAVFASCIRGNGLGFWSSSNGGVDWTRYPVAPGADRQDFYPPVVDPYDAEHLLMAGHEMNVLVESTDAGHTWTRVSTDASMNQNGGTASIFFIDTGDAASTRKTFLWIAQQSDQFGTFRTDDAGATWTRVDKNEHPHGLSQIYQPDTSGVVYMAGAYSALGWGVLRSTDYAKTWAHVGNMGSQAVVFGTAKNVYAMSSGAVGLGGMVDPTFAVAAQPGTGVWTMPGTPQAMTIGAAQAAVLDDGTHAIIVTANWGAGLWRYVEP
jgi:photosystem II stability/assembly factor-like uncharacterized protein